MNCACDRSVFGHVTVIDIWSWCCVECWKSRGYVVRDMVLLHKLVLGGTHCTIAGYSDADWASHLHCHSISGFVYFIGIGIMSWSCKKQPIINLSSTKAKYVALTHSSKDILWIHKLLTELSCIFSFSMPTTLYCDNQGAIRLSKDSTFHSHTKHIDIHFHFIRQTVSSRHIALQYCPTADIIADIFTKSLPHSKFQKFQQLLGLAWSIIVSRGSVGLVLPNWLT